MSTDKSLTDKSPTALFGEVVLRLTLSFLLCLLMGWALQRVALWHFPTLAMGPLKFTVAYMVLAVAFLRHDNDEAPPIGKGVARSLARVVLVLLIGWLFAVVA